MFIPLLPSANAFVKLLVNPLNKIPWTFFLDFISLTPNIPVAGNSIYYSTQHTAIKYSKHRFHCGWKAWVLSVTARCWWVLPQHDIWEDSQRCAVSFACRRAAGADPRRQQEPQVPQQSEEQQTAKGDDEWHVPRRFRVEVFPFCHNSEARLLKQDRKSSSGLHTCKVTDTNGTFHLAELLYWSTWPKLAPGLCRWWADGDSVCWRQWFIPRTCLPTAGAAQMTEMDHRAPGAIKGRWNGDHPRCKKEVPDHVSMSYIKASMSWWGLKASGCLRSCEHTVGGWASSGNTAITEIMVSCYLRQNSK